MPAEAWPSLLVQRGAAAVSGSLADSLGRPPAGATLALHRWSEGGHPVSTAGVKPAPSLSPSTPGRGSSTPGEPPSLPVSSSLTGEADGLPDAKPAAAGGTEAAATPLLEQVTLRLVGTLTRTSKARAAEPRQASLQTSSQQNGADRGNGGAVTGGDWAAQDLAGAGSRQRKLLGALRPACVSTRCHCHYGGRYWGCRVSSNACSSCAVSASRARTQRQFKFAPIVM